MQLTRRDFLTSPAQLGLASVFAASLIPGCVPQKEADRLPDWVWGRRGLSDGRFIRPRALVVSPQDELYVVDKSGRIQVFNIDGEFLRGWHTPEFKNGKPTGLGWSQDGKLMVADTHYFQVLFFQPDGVLDHSRTIGGLQGDEPGQFHFVTDVVQDQRGHYFVGQYGQIDQIQEFDTDRNFVRRWGSQGRQLGEFSRPQALAIDDQGLLWVADACNHRMQVFDVLGLEPKLAFHWGSAGGNPGELKYPYGIDFDVDGTLLVAEWGNHRIQRFTRSGETQGCWGQPGSDAGQFHQPWALALDSHRNLHVLDTENNRIQRYTL